MRGLHPLNTINYLFYSHCPAAFDNSGPANFFVRIAPIQIALKNKIEATIKRDTIYLKELASGASFDRWQTIQELPTNKKWEIMLTDFSQNSLPVVKSLKSDSYSFKTKIENLNSPLQDIKQGKKYDVVLTTYGFDSVWLPEDVHYEKKKGDWFKSKYFLQVKNIRLRDKIDGVLKGSRSSAFEISELSSLKVKKVLQKINILDEPFGDMISKYYAKKENIKINFPGGMIQKTKEAFDKQIEGKGLFIIGDLAVSDRSGYTKRLSLENGLAMEDYLEVGKVAKCKVEDYGLAKKILEIEGFRVEIINLMDFISQNTKEEPPINIVDHVFLIVSRK